MEMDNERERKQQLKDVFHNCGQTLVFNEEQWDHSKRTSNCSACYHPMYGQSYRCTDCNIHLHKKCAELPTEINLPHHLDHMHPLIFYAHCETLFCKFCQIKTKSWGRYYRCSSCEFDIHSNCAWPSLVIEDKTHHELPFHLFLRHYPFICDACGDEGNYASYICFICHLQFHVKYHSLPRIIKITRRNHPLFHNYVVKKKELQKQDCRICFQEVKTRHGSYYCLKDDCNYIVHVNCAVEFPRFYSIFDPENQDEAGENSELVKPSIIVIKKNEHGDATKSKHFSHQHCLFLSDKVNEGEDQHCDGCVQSISGSFYHCSECYFLLHKSCAELPSIIFGFMNTSSPSNQTTFSDVRIVLTNVVVLPANARNAIYPRLKCANILDTREHPGHKHFFYDPTYEGKCTACGTVDENKNIGYAYRCTKQCGIVLDFQCVALPHAVQHKCDKHFLKLSYGDENDDPEKWYYEFVKN